MVATVLSLKDYEGMEIELKKDIRPPYFMKGTRCTILKARRISHTCVAADITNGHNRRAFCYLSDLL